MDRVLLRPRAARGAVELLALLLGRGRGGGQPLAVHRRRPARGAEVLSRHPAGRRGAPRDLLQALHARGLRHRRRDRRRRPGGDPPAADLGLRQDLRAARQAHRRAAPRPLADQARPGRDDVPHHRRGAARPARASTRSPTTSPSATCCPASAAGCTTSRSTSSATSASASSCCATSRRRIRRSREAVADLLREVLPYSLAVFVPPGWDRRYTECFGFTLEEIYEEAARSLESKLRAAGLRDRDAARRRPLAARPAARRARPARDRDARGRADRRAGRRR